MNVNIKKLFLSVEAEEKWLSEMAANGFMLYKRMPLNFEFVLSQETDCKIKIVQLDSAVNNGDAEDKIKEINEKYEVSPLCGYKCRAYYKIPIDSELSEYDDSKAKKAHYSAVFQAYLLALLISLGIVVYNVCFVFMQKMRAERLFALYVLIPAAVAFVIFAFLVSFYADNLLKLRAKIKKNKKKIDKKETSSEDENRNDD